jgi:hypothetical protein
MGGLSCCRKVVADYAVNNLKRKFQSIEVEEQEEEWEV